MYARSRSDEDQRGPMALTDFDPNAKPLPRPEHATYAPFRSPEWKIHSNVGHAKSAMKVHRYIVRYEWVEDATEPPGKGYWREIENRSGQDRREWAEKARK